MFHADKQFQGYQLGFGVKIQLYVQLKILEHEKSTVEYSVRPLLSTISIHQDLANFSIQYFHNK